MWLKAVPIAAAIGSVILSAPPSISAKASNKRFLAFTFAAGGAAVAAIELESETGVGNGIGDGDGNGRFTSGWVSG